MNDKEIWKKSFSNEENINGFEVKPGPPLTEEQIQKRKEELEKQKQKKILDSLQDQVNILKEAVERLERVLKNNLQTKHKPQTVVESNESKITKKQTE